MLKKDREAFALFASGDPSQIARAIAYFQSLEPGHFDDHPLSRKMVAENLGVLVDLWHSNRVPGTRDWVVQFVADAQLASELTKPLVATALLDPSCAFLPTVLYLMGTRPALFADLGVPLTALATHSDPEVRWRVAWFISKVPRLDADLAAAVALLERDTHATTQVYVRACRAKA
ncbi:hypothetical protein [Stenotrophomonas sp. PS02298]|jgi:hypothetical protein|uniref:hypothetical protein n=1 Tax=Stenotrophomonas sp. PS02298 TaxID=2991424 RepID=UPI00249A502E|nr:hypothetical protein [Stenotrophomonas sp. PS02298]